MVEVRDGNMMELPALKWNQEILGDFTHSYDKQRDTLFAYQSPKRPAVSLDVGGHLWIRFDPETSEVVGLEIENFEQVFLVKYPELRIGWEKVKPRIIKVKHGSSVEEYLRLLLMLVENMMRSHPHQQGFAPV